MATIRVYTDDEQLVSSMVVEGSWSPSAVARKVAGIYGPLHGWLSRALVDARILEAGGDPERPSEKAMRLAEEARRR